MGLKDQALALRWVKENIEAFGGDPNQITIFGESAGAASIHHLVLSPSTKGLFNKAISQSGVATPYWGCEPTENAVKYTHKFAKRLNCDTDDTAKLAENLRSKTVAELMAAYKQETPEGVTLRPDLESHFFMPSIEVVNDEEAFLVEHPLTIMAEGRAHKVPWMVGANSDEGLCTSLAFYNNEEVMANYEKNWDNCIHWTFGIPPEIPNAKELADEIKEIYFPKDSNFTKEQRLEQYTKLFTDAQFLLHTSHCISVQSEFTPVYPYYFSRRGGPSLTPIMNMLMGNGHIALKLAKFFATSLYNKITGNKPRDYGVCHADELAMLFKVERMFDVPMNPQSPDYVFSKDMVQLWVDFARDETSMTFRGVEFPKQDPGKHIQYFELCETPQRVYRGVSIHHLVLSPTTKGLFNKAISQSGVATPYWGCEPTLNAVKYTHKFAKRLNCDTADTAKLAENLRSKTVAELMAAYKLETVRILQRSHYTFYNNEEVMGNYEKNWGNCIPWTFGIPPEIPNAKELADEIKEIYFPKDSNFTKEQRLEQYTKLFTDAQLLLHTSHCISVQSEFTPVYSYQFSRRGGPSLTPIVNMVTGKGHMALKIAKYFATSLYNKITGNKPRDYGVCHGDELAMLFKVERMFDVPMNPQSPDYIFSKDMVQLWVDFARDETSMTFRGVEFPKQDPGKHIQYFELCETPQVIEEPFRERVDKLKSLGLINLRLKA
ncbi:unnamed protein product [Allacma fusca]|nr:unnamed protein product [Allacma fusca]